MQSKPLVCYEAGSNTSVEIGDELATFIDSQIRTGRYNSASEVVRAGYAICRTRKPNWRYSGLPFWKGFRVVHPNLSILKPLLPRKRKRA
jgi:antitoxin ParD1/3/4